MAKTAQKQSKSEKMEFQAEVSRLLDIVTNALYSNRDVFLRELISNAADACDRLRYEALQNADLTKDDTEFKISISCDADARTLTIADNGIGMNKEDLIENLGTIARSGTAKIMEQLKDADGSPDLIGQFGVGFYASFMAADKVDVISTKAGDNTAWFWTSDGHSGFEITESSESHARGTKITLHLKADASEYLVPDMLRNVIEKYSDHIDIPVFLEDEETPVNKASAIWSRPKSEVTDEEYDAFYKSLTFGMDEPLLTNHWKAEGKIEYTALLYVPTLRPFDLYEPQRSHAVRLYVKRVFITDSCEGLVYPWLRFLRGVIDSADLPLNISRELLQKNPLIHTIRETVTKRVLKDLDKLSKDDAVKYGAFWMQFGAVIKEGLYDAADHQEALFKLCRFYSSEKPDQLISLEEYIADMPEDQKTIYYISGETVAGVKNSPQLEGFKARGLNVLFMLDTIDEFWLQNQPTFKDFTFKSVTRGAADLKDVDEKEDSKKKENKKEASKDVNFDPLLERMKTLLSEDVEDVILSNRLTDSAVCFVVAEGGVDMQMERVLKIQQKYDAKSRRILEINPGHALIEKLAKQKDKADEESIWMLLDQAKILQGEPVKDPSAFAKRLNKLMS